MEQDGGEVAGIENGNRARAIIANEGERDDLTIAPIEKTLAVRAKPPGLGTPTRVLEHRSARVPGTASRCNVGGDTTTFACRPGHT